MIRRLNDLFPSLLAFCVLAGPACWEVKANFTVNGPGDLLDYGTFRGSFTAVTTPNVSTFDFPANGAGADGKLVSQGYQNGSGLYAYLYQFQVLASSNQELDFGQVNWKWARFEQDLEFIPHTFANGFVYDITTNAAGPTLPSQFTLSNLVQPAQIKGTDFNNVRFNFSLDPIVGGENSDIFVVFARSRPVLSLGAGSLTDGTTPVANVVNADALVPAPEPSSVVAWCIGGASLGLGGMFRLRRSRSLCVA